MNTRTAATTQPVRTGIDTPMTSGWDVSGHRLSTAEVESAIVAHDRLTLRAQQPQRGQIMPAADHDVVPEPRLRDLSGRRRVAEAAVVAQSDELTGQAIVAFVTLQGELQGTPEIEAQIRPHVAEKIGKLARPKRVLSSEDLPKTRSGKIMRRLLRDIAEGRTLGDVTTLRDPTVMAELEQKIAAGQAGEQ